LSYPQYSKLSFFVTGESYAGHYIPALSAFIQRKNMNLSMPEIPINLQGLAIGNGLVDPLIQYRDYAPYALEHALVDKPEYLVMEAGLAGCLPLIDYCRTNSSLGYLACINAYDVCNLLELEPVVLTGVNPYDVRIPCQVPPLCYDFSLLTKFLSQPSVKEQLGVGDHEWHECNRVTDLKLVLAGDWMLNYATDIPLLLANNKRVLVYAGEYDFLCNWLGDSQWVQLLSWPGQEGYDNAANATWSVDGTPAGTVKTFEDLTFLKVFNAGHMVPHDQPQNALDMISRFLSDQSFA